MDNIVKDSKYWKGEIEKTQDVLSQLLRGETAGVKSTKSNDDSISFQDIDKMTRECRLYISYCETQYQKALEEEQGKKPKTKSILYFNSVYGY